MAKNKAMSFPFLTFCSIEIVPALEKAIGKDKSMNQRANWRKQGCFDGMVFFFGEGKELLVKCKTDTTFDKLPAASV